MPPHPSPTAGLALVVVSALAFAANTTAAVISYNDGATPISVATIRMTLTILGLYAFIRLTGRLAVLPRRDQWVALALGVLIAAQAWFLLTAIQRIPIGLAILTLYIYPILMALAAYAMGEERPSAAPVAGLVVAFIGLGLALDVTGDGLDALGIAYAALGALTFTGAAIGSAPIIRRAGDSRTVTLWMHFSATPLFVAAALVDGEFPVPATPAGWLAFLAVPVLYTVAITTFFSAMVALGAVRTGLVMNLEPVASIAFGYLVFGQTLSTVQFAGVGLVLLGVSTVRRERGRTRAG
jgi:drug/metabolite transporter (DMT)-like permease